MRDARDVLVKALGASRGWLDESLAKAGLATASVEREAFLLAYSEAARRLGKSAVAWTREDLARLRSSSVSWPLSSWGADELGRAALLLEAFERAPAEAVSLLEECYARGDNRERQAVLRTLPFLPERERFVPLAVDACRTSVQTVFEAIACDNPVPADHFTDLAFNQMVLKALFVGVKLARIVGLARRLTPELARMAEDYAKERRAAGRPVPEDIDTLTRSST